MTLLGNFSYVSLPQDSCGYNGSLSPPSIEWMNNAMQYNVKHLWVCYIKVLYKTQAILSLLWVQNFTWSSEGVEKLTSINFFQFFLHHLIGSQTKQVEGPTLLTGPNVTLMKYDTHVYFWHWGKNLGLNLDLKTLSYIH